MHPTTLTFGSVVVGIVLASAMVTIVLIVPQSTQPSTFTAQLVQAGEMEYRNGTEVWYVVNLTIQDSTPATLAAARFEYAFSGSNGLVLGPNGTQVSSVTDSYDPSSIPNWLVVTDGNEVWSGYAGTVKNPNGGPVGLYCAGESYAPCTGENIQQGSSSIDSGATLTIDFPTGVSPSGYLVTVSYEGYSGSASVGLT